MQYNYNTIVIISSVINIFGKKNGYTLFVNGMFQKTNVWCGL